MVGVGYEAAYRKYNRNTTEPTIINRKLMVLPNNSFSSYHVE
jgi:hypothetical protein